MEQGEESLVDAASRIGELEAAKAESDDRLLRALAENQNIQRRAEAQRADAVRYGNAELVKSLLAVLDDLERTLAAVPSGQADNPLVAGVRLAQENFIKALRNHGVEPIDASGQRFDPTLHSALMQEPSKDAVAGTVTRQVAKGYRIRDRVVRPAMVVVSSGSVTNDAT